MDCDMFEHPATQQNLKKLASCGVISIEPAEGELASGLTGKGRLEQPENIVNDIIQYFDNQNILKGKKILVTAGPTYEKIDPVRFIGNYSSGKMGYAIAEELAKYGADVILVSGPTHLKVISEHIELIRVNSANEMFQACISFFSGCDAAIMSAAVADFTPLAPARNKINRENSNITIELKPTKDIAAELGKLKKENQILVGFALETEFEKNNADKKLKKKNFDFIVLNSLQDAGAGFNFDTNKVSIIEKNGSVTDFELKLKTEVASDIAEKVITYLNTI